VWLASRSAARCFVRQREFPWVFDVSLHSAQTPNFIRLIDLPLTDFGLQESNTVAGPTFSFDRAGPDGGGLTGSREPATWMMMGMALLGTVAVRRFRPRGQLRVGPGRDIRE
jgi:hypothetical protein